jgi:pilus assembly protein CpaC
MNPFLKSRKQERRLIPIALIVTMAIQVCSIAFPGLTNASFAQQPSLEKTLPITNMKPLVVMPDMSNLASKPIAATSGNSPKSPSSLGRDMSPAYALQQLDEGDKPGRRPENTTKSLQGSVTSIHVTRGRSQIVKFAQPIMRLSIADPSIADLIPLSPDQIMINGKQRGVTSLIVWDENGQEGIFDLYAQNDSSELLDAVQAIAPNEKIQARVTDDSFILSGQVSNSVILDEIRKTAAAYGFRDDKFIDLTDTPVPQVMLEVRMAEASRSVGRALRTGFSQSSGSLTLTRMANAIDSGILAQVVDHLVGQGGNVTRATAGIIPVRPLAVSTSSSNVGGLTGSFKFSDNLSAIWDLLETRGKINTLANPTLVCTHGRTASFLAGGEFPFVGSVDQNGSPIVSYKEFGVKLNFTPWISPSSGRIELKVQPEVSNLDSSNCVAAGGGSTVCGILKRSTDTTVQLMDGETLMISGILSREEQNTFSQTPFIGNVPVLGNMFKNGNLSKTDRELMVIITPHIVKASDYGKVLGSAQ